MNKRNTVFQDLNDDEPETILYEEDEPYDVGIDSAYGFGNYEE